MRNHSRTGQIGAVLAALCLVPAGCKKKTAAPDAENVINNAATPKAADPQSACPTQAPASSPLSMSMHLLGDSTSTGGQNVGALDIGNAMVDQLDTELLASYAPAVATSVSESARNQMKAAVSNLAAPGSAAPISVVAPPIVQGGVLSLSLACTNASTTTAKLGLVDDIVQDSLATLKGRTTALSAADTAAVIGTMANAAVKTLPQASLAGDSAAQSVPVVTKASVAGLTKAGVGSDSIGLAAGKIAAGATSALRTSGFETTGIVALSAQVAGSAVAGLHDAGLSPDAIQQSGAIGQIISGSVAGVQAGATSSDEVVNALAAVAGGAVGALASAGLTTTDAKSAALASVINAAVSAAQSLAQGSTDVMAGALTAVASQVVVSLSAGGFQPDEVGSAVSVVVQTGVSALATAGISDASAATEISSKIVAGALAGTGTLLKNGTITTDQATASASGASTGAVSGLSTLQSAGIVSGDAALAFKSSVSNSITSGLVSSGVSADVAASVQSGATATVVPTVTTPTISPSASTAYTDAISVTITSDSGASIRYTLDGSTPSPTTGTVYVSAFALRSSKTVKAIAYKANAYPSAVATSVYSVTLPTFGASASFATGSQPIGVAVGDLNGDGKADLAVALYSGQGVSILFGNNDGTFATHQDISNSGNGSNINSVLIAVGDLNNDGKPDLTWGAWGNNLVSVALNTTTTGSSTFTMSTTNPWTSNVGLSGPQSVVIGDFDLDGYPDIAVGEENAGRRVAIYQNSSTTPGTFTMYSSYFNLNDASAFTGNLSPAMIASGDFNGDGKLDLVAGGTSTGAMTVLLNTNTTPGTPSFSSPFGFNTNTLLGCTQNQVVRVADLNGDGKDDIVATCTGTSIAIFLNTAATGATTPTFTPSVITATAGTVAIAVGDVDGDGKVDIVAAVANTIDFYKGNGDGTFASPVSFPIGTPTSAQTQIVLADLNGDGRPDVVLTNGDNDMVTVLLNQTAP